ncbi:ribosomal protein S18 acetylase RimI-like enzyme [Paraburkholderia sp. GAS41]|jgi:ribosomal protein S18 acetylase RimI-like enzyme|uniref:GNAT family N-acetyltransferase n=1 Tax=Paraburkholderia sp. GAS41 TaxID=3035134 RepID=UPI003D23C411
MLHTRALVADDLELICRHRYEMFREAGREPAVLERMTAAFRIWLQPRLADASYFGFITLDDEAPVAGIGLMEIDWPPHPLHPEQDRRGYVLNVYVEPSYRQRGIARALMARAEAEFSERGLPYAILHATEIGRPLYAALGWAPTTEMAKAIGAAPAA